MKHTQAPLTRLVAHSVFCGALGLGLGVTIACGPPKDRYYYSSPKDDGVDEPDMRELQPDQSSPAGCRNELDCPAKPNAEAACARQGALGVCEYTCAQGWGDPMGQRHERGCTCDRSVSSCQLVAVCGDGFIEGDETCDDGPQNSDTRADACRTSCQAARCGDGVKDTSEQCDDGDEDNTDECTSRCTPCGNGTLDPGEACDDGNAADGDGCDSACQVEALWACDTDASPSTCWQEWAPPAGRPFIKDFGAAIDLWDGVAAVGAPGDETYAEKGGSVHVYEIVQGQWRYIQELKPDEDMAKNSAFGSHLLVTRDGDIIVGSPGPRGQSTFEGAIYIFRKENDVWIKKQRIRGSDVQRTILGANLSYDRDILASGSPTLFNNRGTVNIFNRTNRNLPFQLKHTEIGFAEGDGYGSQTAIINTQDTAIVAYAATAYNQLQTQGQGIIVGNLIRNNEFITIYPGQGSVFSIGSKGLCINTDSISYLTLYAHPRDQNTLLMDMENFTMRSDPKQVNQKITPYDLSYNNFDTDLINPLQNIKMYTLEMKCKEDIMTIFTPNAHNHQGQAFVYQKSGLTWVYRNTDYARPPSRYRSVGFDFGDRRATADASWILLSVPRLANGLTVDPGFSGRVFPVKMR